VPRDPSSGVFIIDKLKAMVYVPAMTNPGTICTGCGGTDEPAEHEIDDGETVERYCDTCAAALVMLSQQMLGVLPSGREAAHA